MTSRGGRIYPQSPAEPPRAVWRRFLIWSVLALLGFLALIRSDGYSGVILLGWAFGMVVAAALILFRQRG